MVDFQSRDTRRSIGDDADEEAADEESAESAPVDQDVEPAPEESTTVEDREPDTAETDDDSPADGTSGDPATADQPDADGTEPATDGVDVALVAVGAAGSGAAADRLTDALDRSGHAVTATRELAGGYDEIQETVDALVSRPDVEAVVTVGGTGVRQDEVVIEAVHPLFEKVLPGFGEVVRNLLFYGEGTGVVGVRTTAGIAGAAPVFCLPGETDLAVRAVEDVVAPEVPELVEELS